MEIALDDISESSQQLSTRPPKHEPDAVPHYASANRALSSGHVSRCSRLGTQLSHGELVIVPADAA